MGRLLSQAFQQEYSGKRCICHPIGLSMVDGKLVRDAGDISHIVVNIQNQCRRVLNRKGC